MKQLYIWIIHAAECKIVLATAMFTAADHLLCVMFSSTGRDRAHILHGGWQDRNLRFHAANLLQVSTPAALVTVNLWATNVDATWWWLQFTLHTRYCLLVKTHGIHAKDKRFTREKCPHCLYQPCCYTALRSHTGIISHSANTLISGYWYLGMLPTWYIATLLLYCSNNPYGNHSPFGKCLNLWRLLHSELSAKQLLPIKAQNTK